MLAAALSQLVCSQSDVTGSRYIKITVTRAVKVEGGSTQGSGFGLLRVATILIIMAVVNLQVSVTVETQVGRTNLKTMLFRAAMVITEHVLVVTFPWSGCRSREASTFRSTLLLCFH